MAMTVRLRLGTILLTLGLCVATAHGEDVLILRNGRKARGEIVEETEQRVRLRMAAGSLWYQREMIQEIIRGEKEPDEAEPAPLVSVAGGREEHSLLYRDGKRVGTRVFRLIVRADHFQFEEELQFAATDEEPERIVRVVERCDRQFKPLFLQVRESRGEDHHSLAEARVRAGQMVVNAVVDAERELVSSPVPTGGRFPLAAREFFFREFQGLGGVLRVRVYDLASKRWGTVVYSDEGPKRIEITGGSFNPGVEEVRVLLRKRDGRTEREWLAADLTSRLTELDIPVDPEAVERARSGKFEDKTGFDAVAADKHGDAAAGWSVDKPDPSWIFERPSVEGGGALVTVRQEALSASVNVLLDPAAPKGVTIEQAAESLQRLCRSIAPDFRVVDEHYGKGEDDRDYWLEATATTKGEKTRTLARVVIRGDRVFRLLAACPDQWFDLCRPDFEKILKSLTVE